MFHIIMSNRVLQRALDTYYQKHATKPNTKSCFMSDSERHIYALTDAAECEIIQLLILHDNYLHA